MEIKNKYNIGDKIYVMVKEGKGGVTIFKDEISSIVIYKNNFTYMLDDTCDETDEKNILHPVQEEIITWLKENK